MDKEYVMHIAQTIKEQLVSLTPMPILMSWGIGDFVATVFRDLPALRIKVNGRLHAGNVVIALNGSDYYEVYLLKENGAECVNEEVCFDELGDVIDRAVESGTDKEEYDKFCDRQLAVLLSGTRAWNKPRRTEITPPIFLRGRCFRVRLDCVQAMQRLPIES